MIKLKNPDLFKDKSLVGGEWVEAKSGKRFDVYGRLSISTRNLRPQPVDQIEL